MKQPKFQIGDKVSMRTKTLYGETEGKITEVRKVYQETWEDGSFRSDGLCYDENEIENISIEHTFDGETLTIKSPQREFSTFILKAETRVHKFNGYSYTVKTPKINTLYYEKSLIKI
jgi:hypothetical protein